MTGSPGLFGGSFPPNAGILSFKTMALAGSTTSVKCPSVVTVEAGTTNYTAGWELEASQQTGWLPIQNLDMFSYICDNATDDLLVWVV
jgi:hypothetical protein